MRWLSRLLLLLMMMIMMMTPVEEKHYTFFLASDTQLGKDMSDVTVCLPFGMRLDK